MPGYVAGKAVRLRAGQQQAVLLAESLASGATQAVLLDAAQGAPVPLTIINFSGEICTLEVAAENIEANFVPWTGAAGAAPASGATQYVEVTGGLFYRLLPSAPVTSGSAWLCR